MLEQGGDTKENISMVHKKSIQPICWQNYIQSMRHVGTFPTSNNIIYTRIKMVNKISDSFQWMWSKRSQVSQQLSWETGVRNKKNNIPTKTECQGIHMSRIEKTWKCSIHLGEFFTVMKSTSGPGPNVVKSNGFTNRSGQMRFTLLVSVPDE